MGQGRSLLILGLGNVLCGDDGLGVEAVRRFAQRYETPPGARILDGGTLGLSLLGCFERDDVVVLVDAIGAPADAGTLVRLDGEDVGPAVRDRLSPHQVGVADLLDALRLIDRYPRQLVLLGLVPATLELGTDLSPPVTAALSGLVDELAAEVRRLGFELRPRWGHEADPRSALDSLPAAPSL